MGKKHSFNSAFKMLCVLYVTYFLGSIQAALEIGVLNENNTFLRFINKFSITMGKDTVSFIFYLTFLMFIYKSIRLDMKEIDTFEDSKRESKLRSKLLPYKLFVGITVLLGLYLIIISKKVDVILLSSLLIITGILIYYARLGYLKSYIFDRKIQWIEHVNYGGEDKNKLLVDTIKWRYKIWFNKIEKVKFKYRINSIVISTTRLVLLFMLFRIDSSLIFKFFIGYFILYNLIYLVEYVFGLFTSISGVCTGVWESKSKNGGYYYNIIVTDYKNKREMKISTKEDNNIKEMDNLAIVHSMFTKKLVSINLIPEKQKLRTNTILYACVVLCSFCLTLDIFNKPYYQEEVTATQETKTDELYQLENVEERLSKNIDNYKKIIVIDKEQSFKDVTIKVEKLYLGNKGSKLEFKIKNSSDKGLVLNVSYNTHIDSENDGKNSNILLPGEEYKCEMDFNDKYSRNMKRLTIDLEYTLSEHIIFGQGYRDYSYYNYYPLNVIDNDCLIDIDLKNEKVDLSFNEYDQFYNVSKDDIVKFYE